MSYNRAFLPWIYPLAALLVVVPLLDVAARTWPAAPRDLEWRFGAMGIAFNTLVTPLLGAGIAMLVAALADHRRLLRFLAVVATCAGIALMAALSIFILDALQLRPTVPVDAREDYDAAAIEAFIAGALCVPVVLILGTGGWAATRSRRPPGREPDVGLVIRPRKESRV